MQGSGPTGNGPWSACGSEHVSECLFHEVVTPPARVKCPFREDCSAFHLKAKNAPTASRKNQMRPRRKQYKPGRRVVAHDDRRQPPPRTRDHRIPHMTAHRPVPRPQHPSPRRDPVRTPPQQAGPRTTRQPKQPLQPVRVNPHLSRHRQPPIRSHGSQPGNSTVTRCSTPPQPPSGPNTRCRPITNRRPRCAVDVCGTQHSTAL